jgi:hypothetical protein
VDKRKKIEALQLSDREWSNVKLMILILQVSFSTSVVLLDRCLIFSQDSDRAQNSLSYENGASMHLVIPALEGLRRAWMSKLSKDKYECFHPALVAAIEKLDFYLDKMRESDAHLVAMGTLQIYLRADLLTIFQSWTRCRS